MAHDEVLALRHDFERGRRLAAQNDNPPTGLRTRMPCTICQSLRFPAGGPHSTAARRDTARSHRRDCAGVRTWTGGTFVWKRKSSDFEMMITRVAALLVVGADDYTSFFAPLMLIDHLTAQPRRVPPGVALVSAYDNTVLVSDLAASTVMSHPASWFAA